MHVYIINHFYIYIYTVYTHVAKGAQESHPSFCELSSLTPRGSLVLQGTAEPEDEQCNLRAESPPAL